MYALCFGAIAIVSVLAYIRVSEHTRNIERIVEASNNRVGGTLVHSVLVRQFGSGGWSIVRLSTVLLVIALALSTTGCSTQPAQPTASAGQECSETAIVGLRGSGQLRFSGDSFRGSAVLQRFAAGVRAGDAHAPLREVNVKYNANAVPGSLTNSAELAAYASSIEAGASATIAAISQVLKRCSGAQVIVVGYSQGAWAARLGLNRLAGQKRAGSASAAKALHSIRAVALIGDPLRSPESVGERLGTAGKSGVGVANGLSFLFEAALERHKIAFSSDLFEISTKYGADRTIEVCNLGDIVCNVKSARGEYWVQGSAVHVASYITGGKNSLAQQAGMHAVRTKTPENETK